MSVEVETFKDHGDHAREHERKVDSAIDDRDCRALSENDRDPPHTGKKSWSAVRSSSTI